MMPGSREYLKINILYSGTHGGCSDAARLYVLPTWTWSLLSSRNSQVVILFLIFLIFLIFLLFLFADEEE